MKNRQLAIALFLLLPLWPGNVTAQVLWPNPIIGGLPVSCGGVPAVVQAVDDVAVSVQGAIVLNPVFFRLPGKAQIFIYGHECAHQILGPDEARADCWAIQTGRDQGWFRQSDMTYLIQLFENSPGDWTHAPGRQRIAQMMACFSASSPSADPGLRGPSLDNSADASAPTVPRRRIGTLAKGRSIRLTYELRRGVTYTFEGSCDDNCDDLDLVILHGSEKVVSSTEYSEVSVTPERAGTYTLEVLMQGCNANRCRYWIDEKEN